MSKRISISTAILAASLAAALTVTSCHPTAATTTPRPTGPVAMFGDSITQSASSELRLMYAADHPGSSLTVSAMGGTALCDWVPRIRQAIARPAAERPAAIVLAWNGNNLTPCAAQPIGSAAFLASYRTAMDQVAEAARTSGVTVVWAKTLVRAETDPAPGLNETFATMAEAHGWKVVDASRAVADTHGRWTKTLPCLTWETAAQGCTDGRIDVRSSDRTHFGPDDGNPYSSGRIRWATALSAQLP